METYFAHGKLLLSAEYAILHGAKGIALPLNKGQRLHFFKEKKKNSKAVIKWTAFDQNNYPWFEAIFNKSDKAIIKCTYKGAAEILKKLFQLVPKKFFNEDCDYRFETYLEFDKSWGWGTSSTMVSLLAQCTGSDPYQLYQSTFKGSGFDLACAVADGPILYQLNTQNQPKVKEIAFNPSFKDNIFFVYLGKKQSSLKSIRAQKQPDKALIEEVTTITLGLQEAQNNQKEFCDLIEEHERLLSDYLGIPTVKEEYFPEINTSIKSLGAWGGDFVMMIGDREDLQAIRSKGYETTFGWKDIVL